jgi:ABC-2 type transport system permease protein
VLGREANLHSLSDHVALYRRLVGARAKGQLQYRFSFVVLLAGNVLATLVDFVAIVVLFGRVATLAGWSLGEVALMYGLALACFGLAEIFSPGFDLFSRLIVQGTFDRVLTRPLGAFFQILASDVALRKTGRVAQGAIIVAVAQAAIPVHWTPDKVGALALAVPSGTATFFGVFVIGAASTFWTIQANEAVNIFTNGGLTMMNYPLEVYHAWLRRFVTFVVPLAFVSYYPTLYVLGRADPLGLPSWLGLLSPLAAVAFTGVAATAWSIGVRHYTSVGN